MLVSITLIFAGFVLLIWSADRFVMGAAALARNLGASPLLIGLTIVGFGTSAPEILVSGMASLQGNPGLAIGNALGSNIANIGLILGITAIVVPLAVNSDVLRKEYPLLLIVSMVSYVLLMDDELGRMDGAILMLGLFASMFIVVKIGQRRQQSDELAQEFTDEIPADMSTGRSIMWFCIGLVLLLIGSRLLVTGAVDIAKAFGVSDLVIGLTIVAVGTSLPELATSIASALKGEHEMAVGNILGSNLYNLLATSGTGGAAAGHAGDAGTDTGAIPHGYRTRWQGQYHPHGWRHPVADLHCLPVLGILCESLSILWTPILLLTVGTSFEDSPHGAVGSTA